MRKIIIFLLLLCTHFSARGQTQYEYCYWFDGDIATAEKGSTTSDAWLMEVDLSRLSESFHTIHLQVTDENGVSSAPVTRCFFLAREGGALTGGYYWFDNEKRTREVDGDAQGTLTFDVTELQEGFHTLHYQVLRADGLYSQIETRTFYKVMSEQALGQLTFMCYIDGAPFKQERISADQGMATWLLDVSELPIGFHKLQVRAIMENGASTTNRETFFLRTAMDSEVDALACIFSIDGKPYKTVESHVNDGLFHCDLDVAELPDGLHKISYILTDGKGAQTDVKSQYFFKQPVGGNSITKYTYWLNDKDDAAHTVEQTEVTDPLKLTALLPVEQQPLRSSLFHFEVKDGQPKMFAKNDIHFRFYDNSGRWVDDDAQYVDYSVSEQVTPVGELQATQTFPRVAENDARWYTVNLEPGDSVAFKASQACTMQLFSPSGEEVFKTSESASVAWDGCHVWEDNTYYLAVHDVTGTQNNMTIDYMHMDKYDVVDWDVHTVGNGGCSTITFKGNGFRDLYRVDLYNAVGDTIRSVDVGHESDAETSVTFDFNGAELGEYDALFRFTQEDKHVAGVVTVEEPVDIELATNVSFPSTFLRGTSTTYTIKITNKGNMTAYCLPVDIRLRIISKQDISEIRFSENLESFCIPQELSTDSLDEDVLSVLKEEMINFSDLAQFVFFTDSLTNTDCGLAQLFLNIRPNTTETFTITIQSASTVSLETTTTKEWIPFTFADLAFNTRTMRVKRKSRDWMCCHREKIECVADVVANIAGSFMPPGANCATSIAITGLEAAYDIWCSEGNTVSEKFESYLNSQGKSLARKLLNSAISCVTGYFDRYLKNLKMDRAEAMEHNDIPRIKELNRQIFSAEKSLKYILSNLGKGIVYGFVGNDCILSLAKPIPNCPPNPDGGGGSSTPQPPVDPNDIYGYLSDSGTQFLADSVARVNYTIEFENDTTFATASAHTIVVKDTLDSRYFDLNTFAPTMVKIGDKQEFIDGTPNFVKTIDMRPEINAIAQVTGEYDQTKGIATWTFQSLDPMTMEPTDDLMQGILPVNYNGTSGIGEVGFDIGMKPNKGDGTEVNNRACITFDYEESIMTPTWTNIVDATRPTSRVVDGTVVGDSIVLQLEGEDNLSGIWKYDVYAQQGQGAPWVKVAENVTGTECTVAFYSGIEYGFCAVATDMAGNVEQKTLARDEFGITQYILGDVNDDGHLTMDDVTFLVNIILGKQQHYTALFADVNRDGKVTIADVTALVNMFISEE